MTVAFLGGMEFDGSQKVDNSESNMEAHSPPPLPIGYVNFFLHFRMDTHLAHQK